MSNGDHPGAVLVTIDVLHSDGTVDAKESKHIHIPCKNVQPIGVAAEVNKAVEKIKDKYEK